MAVRSSFLLEPSCTAPQSAPSQEAALEAGMRSSSKHDEISSRFGILAAIPNVHLSCHFGGKKAQLCKYFKNVVFYFCGNKDFGEKTESNTRSLCHSFFIIILLPLQILCLLLIFISFLFASKYLSFYLLFP